MVIALRLFFATVFLSMLALTSWAGCQVPLWAIPRGVAWHPWFIATLGDAYWAFFTFYVWMCYKETSWLSRALWLVAIVLLGNIAMSAYGLAVTLRLPGDATAADLLLRGTPVRVVVPITLITTFAIIAICTAA